MPQLPQVKTPIVRPDSDVAQTTRDFLENLNLLPSTDQLAAAGGPGAAMTGPPQSVALIEAGATAASKWWSAGGAALGIGAWGVVRTMWDGNEGLHDVMLWTASIVTAAVIFGIAMLLASDVRGRADAAVATIRARADIGLAMLDAARLAVQPGSAAHDGQSVMPLPGLPVRNLEGEDSAGWMAIALRGSATTPATSYLLVNGQRKAWVPSDDVEFENPAVLVVGNSI